MSMDQVRDELRRFERDLERFNGTMQAAVNALQKSHEQVDGLWRDSFRQEYDRRWNAFGTNMSSYLGREAHKYESFVKSRIMHVSRYLGG